MYERLAADPEIRRTSEQTFLLSKFLPFPLVTYMYKQHCRYFHEGSAVNPSSPFPHHLSAMVPSNPTAHRSQIISLHSITSFLTPCNVPAIPSTTSAPLLTRAIVALCAFADFAWVSARGAIVISTQISAFWPASIEVARSMTTREEAEGYVHSHHFARADADDALINTTASFGCWRGGGTVCGVALPFGFCSITWKAWCRHAVNGNGGYG